MTQIFRALSLVVVFAAAPPVLANDYGTVAGKTPSELLPWARFDPAIPTQESITGVVPGSRPLRHAELMSYFEALAEASPRARLDTYAESHEGRELVVLAVSDQVTIVNLDEFRESHAVRMDSRGRSDDSDALNGAKAVAWMAYGIHGDELSSVDAASVLAYWLVAGEDERARALRDSLVVLIDPMQNPDGRDRYLAQIASFAHKTPSPDQDDLSHTTVWPWGRGNHYLFDLNRDWFTMIHPESRRSELIASWNPQIVLDCHEMGDNDSYLFSPPREPHNPLLPPYSMKWWERFAADQALALDERGYGYYSGEWNEEFFPGYGSSWSSYLGAIGILYEMSGTAGTLVRRSDGTVRTYAEAVEHQVASSVSNLETLSVNREELLRDFVGARRAVVSNPAGPARAWLFPPGRQPARTDEMANVLRRQGVEVLRAEEAITISGLRNLRTGSTSTETLPPGTWMVPLDQPLSPLAAVLLAPHVPMDPAYLREERESIERGDGSRLYDATAWSMPLLWGVEAYWTATRPTGSWAGDGTVIAPTGEVVDQSSAYAYLLGGDSDASMGALAEILQRDLKVSVADKAFEVAARSYERGSLLIRREGNPDDLAAQLSAVARRWSVQFHATPTAKAEVGPDLGGSHFRSLRSPKVGVFAGMPVSPSDYGSVWYLFDERAGLPFNGIDLAFVGGLSFERYDVLIFPPALGGPGNYREALGESGLASLKSWIEAGGTAIGLGGGADFLAGKDMELTAARLRRDVLGDFPPLVLGASAAAAAAAAPMRAVGMTGRSDAVDTASSEIAPVLGPGARPFAPGVSSAVLEPTPLNEWIEPWLPSGRKVASEADLQKADARLRGFSPRGVILRAAVDQRHWLGWGLPPTIDVLYNTSTTFVAEGDVDVAARFVAPGELHLGGLLWPEAAGRIAHTGYVMRERRGSGQVVLFANHPTYRGWVRDTERMLLNAVLYGPGLGTSRPNPW